MPRSPRKKSVECRYHVMSRSISERDLFCDDEDKTYYIMLLKRYRNKCQCSLYAYCLMNNHVHLYINSCGYDISRFMLCLNTAYVSYYNKKHKRHGHLFQGRFASTIVRNDAYSLTLSAYIHNNAKDLPGYEGNEEQYRYSSYGIYTGAREDYEKIIDADEILRMFCKDKEVSLKKYRSFTESMKETGIMSEVDNTIMGAYTENVYLSEKRYVVRNTSPEVIINKIKESLDEHLPEGLRTKHSRENSNIRAFVTYVMRTLCGFTYKQLCEYIGNMSMSGISRLSNEGFNLISKNIKYQQVFNSLIYTT